MLDLRQYFPDSKVSILKKQNGSNYSRYTFTKEPSGFLNLYTQFLSQNKPGYHYTWKKEYWKSGVWCAATFAVLFMGDDLSVTEVGDWYASVPCTPNTVFGYKNLNNTANSGLLWSGVGGLSTTPIIQEVNIWNQSSSGTAYTYKNSQAYSKTGLIEHLDTYTNPLTGIVYNDVVHLVMYHGTKTTTSTPLRCDVPPISANGAYYQSYKNYNSYAIELWLAKDVGIIRENTPFIEDGSYWSIPNFSGGIFSGDWNSYIDE